MKGRNVILHWLDKAFKDKKAKDNEMKFNEAGHVLCTGGDGDILMQLLQPHYGGVIEQSPSDSLSSKNGSSTPRYTVETSKHLIHYGVACVLAAQVELRRRKAEFAKNPGSEHVKKRVAKHFESEEDDGDNIFRGTVSELVTVDDGPNVFLVKYDDGDSEEVSLDELFGE